MNKDSKSESNTIPYSGQIIGAIVDALDIKDEILTDKTAKRYYLIPEKMSDVDGGKSLYLREFILAAVPDEVTEQDLISCDCR